MTKRRKISEIYKDVEEINNWKPSDKDLEEISDAINENIEEDDIPLDQIAKPNQKEGNINGHESDRI